MKVAPRVSRPFYGREALFYCQKNNEIDEQEEYAYLFLSRESGNGVSPIRKDLPNGLARDILN